MFNQSHYSGSGKSICSPRYPLQVLRRKVLLRIFICSKVAACEQNCKPFCQRVASRSTIDSTWPVSHPIAMGLSFIHSLAPPGGAPVVYSITQAGMLRKKERCPGWRGIVIVETGRGNQRWACGSLRHTLCERLCVWYF